MHNGDMAVSIARMSEQQSRAWLALISTAELLPAALDAQLQRDAQLTHYEYVLLTVLQRTGAMSLSDLAAATNATLPRASKVVTRLRERGLLERQGSERDRRAVEIRITSDGRRTLVRATPGHLDTVHELVLDRLTDEQLEMLGDALEPVVAALDPQARYGPR